MKQQLGNTLRGIIFGSLLVGCSTTPKNTLPAAPLEAAPLEAAPLQTPRKVINTVLGGVGAVVVDVAILPGKIITGILTGGVEKMDMVNDDKPVLSLFDSELESVDIKDWLKQVVQNLPMEKVAEQRCKGKNLSLSTPQLMVCFELAEKDKDKELFRNSLVDQAILLSDQRCYGRIRVIETSMKSANTSVGLLGELSTAVGTFASDSLTSRAASAVSGAANGMLKQVNANYFSDKGVGAIKRIILDKRESMNKDMDTLRQEKEENYREWPLSRAMRDVMEYDRACEIFY
ncbi:MAG: hypothetical protein COA43_07490 [Robiginitomaculum sp.]|nr:MAG: hypothetical protein COA43_07490 [Robiginitomaculum sp.]